MASPQCEDGYTRFANELLEQLVAFRIPGQELRIVLFVARKTYGFGKKTDQISYGQISKATSIPRARVIEHVKSLVSKMILGSLNNGTRQPLTLWINKNYEQWKPSPKKGTSLNYETNPSPIYGNKTSPNNGTHKRKKENKQKKGGYTNEFEQFWQVYPKKVGKGGAFKVWKRLNGTRPGINELVEIVEQQKQSIEWNKDGGQYIPNPQTWLNQHRWEDELTIQKSDNTEPIT